jgi:1,4-dihydroxy-2-naphthoate octaprenyltransferase
MPTSRTQAHPDNAQELVGQQPPVQTQPASARTMLAAFARICRVDAALAVTAPVLTTTCVIWWQTGQIDWVVLAFTLGAMFSMALGVHLLDEFYDYSQSKTADAKPMFEPAVTGFGVLSQGGVLPSTVASLGFVMIVVSALCVLWLGLLAGWPMMLFLGIALVLGVAHAVPPVRYSARGWGLGESGLLVAFGLLPVIASSYGQVHSFSPLITWGGLPFALLAAAIVLNFNLMHHRRDWLMRKKTMAVLLGVARTIDLSTVLVILPFVSIMFAAVVTALPLRTMVALAALPIAVGAYSNLDREDPSIAAGNHLYTVSVQATLVAALLYCLALVSDRLW